MSEGLPQNLSAVKGAVLINKRQVQAQEWLNFLKRDFYNLTDGLYDATILILAGRHGEEDGSIGARQDIVIVNHQRLVIN